MVPRRSSAGSTKVTTRAFVKTGSPSRTGVFVGLMTAGAYGEHGGGTAEWEVCHPFGAQVVPPVPYSNHAGRGLVKAARRPRGWTVRHGGVRALWPRHLHGRPAAIDGVELTTCQRLVAEQDDECQFLVTTSFRLGVGCEDDLSFAGFQGQTLSSFCPGSCGRAWTRQQLPRMLRRFALGPKECTRCPAGSCSINHGAYNPSLRSLRF